jgi:hypothetical protein
MQKYLKQKQHTRRKYWRLNYRRGSAANFLETVSSDQHLGLQASASLGEIISYVSLDVRVA